MLQPGTTLQFTNFKNKIRRPYIVFADFECKLVKTGLDSNIHRHEPIVACFYVVCDHDSSQNKLWYSVGPNCVIDMLVELTTLSDACISKMKENKQMELTLDDEINFIHAKTCHICNKKSTNK